MHRIPLPLPSDALRAVNVYAIQDAGGLILIDSGWALEESRRLLEAALAELGHDLGDISRFLVTHVHRDHYTQALVVRRLLGSRVALGTGEAPVLAEIRANIGRFPPLMLAPAPGRGRRLTWPARLVSAAGPDEAPPSAATGRTPTSGWPTAPRSPWAAGPCGPSPRPGTPAGIWCSTTRRPACCSPATTCCRTSRRRSGSTRFPPTGRWRIT